MSIAQVAKLAGVSNATVSRVINANPRVAVETVRSVRKAMQQLGYSPPVRRPGPKPLGPRPRPGDAAAVAFLVMGTSRGRATPGFEELLNGVSAGVSQNGLALAFHHVADPQNLPPRLLEPQRVDGLLLHGAAPGEALLERFRDVPTVWLMRNRSRPHWGDQVAPDGLEIGRLAADYLIDRGHRLLAFLNLDAGHAALRMYEHAFAVSAEERNVGVMRLEQPRDEGEFNGAGYWREPGTEAVSRLVRQYLSLVPRPTGLFVAEDMQVALIQPALQAAGVRIGGAGEVEIISCNREEPYLFGLQPRPATIDLRLDSIGRRAVEQLLWRLEHRDVPERIITTIEPLVVVPDAAGRPFPRGGRFDDDLPDNGDE